MTEKTEKTATEIEREKVNVTSQEKPLDYEATEKDDAKTDDENKVSEDDDGKKEKTEEAIENNQEEIEASEKTEEDLAVELKAAETQAEKDKIQKRINREVGKRKALETRIAELENQLNAKKEGEALTEEDVNKRAEELANAKINKAEFDRAVDRLEKAGNKLDDKFGDKIEDLAGDIGPVPGRVIGICDDLDNGAAVLLHLTEDHEETLKIYALPPEKMAMRLMKISTELEVKGKVKPKDISKVPEPIKPLGGKSVNDTPLNDKMDMRDWVTKRREQLEKAGKRNLL